MTKDDRLKLISIHSYKGGVGKTTVSALMAMTLAANTSRRVCLVDLDLLAPGLHYLFGMQPTRPCLQNALIADPFQPDVPVESSDLCHVVKNSPRADALLLLGASPALKGAAHIQSYVLADARAELLGARLERVLRDVKREKHIDIFVLDTPPRFSVSRGRRAAW